jgi:hypothetical protein
MVDAVLVLKRHCLVEKFKWKIFNGFYKITYSANLSQPLQKVKTHKGIW